MPPSKRKRQDLDDSDEDEPAYGKQILPVANLPEDFSEEPMNGMQYLFTVRRDSRQLPDIVRAANPYGIPEPTVEHQTPSVQVELPSKEWRDLFEMRFENFRKNLDQPTIHVGPADDVSYRMMPEKKDRELWWAFLAGRPESEWNPPRKSKRQMKSQQYVDHGMRAWTNDTPDPSHDSWQNNDEGEVEQVLTMDPAESLPSPLGTPVALDFLEGISQPYCSQSTSVPDCDEIAFIPREPSTRILKLIDERMALHLLMYFTHWINVHLQAPNHSSLPTESHARWILSLLSRIDDYISADDMNLLRNLARACLGLLREIKQKHNSSSTYLGPLGLKPMGETSCWIIITAVAGVWKQHDLWMDAEAMLIKLKT
ncbi:hypothetical protein B0H34DRAFT_671336 [Crassisporium funariophilum]|nr:hypothetical protein B0H34DRAFT_671336 [Crassisporium funariophilum]